LARKAKNKPEQFEGGPIETLEATVGGGPYEQTGLILSSLRTNAEAVEVNTVF
jgi:hypothetical protein